MRRLSPDFTLQEFECRSGDETPPGIIRELEQLVACVLQPIRTAWGGPIVVTSGYRSLAYNEALRQQSLARNGGVTGVAKRSQHCLGRAADIAPVHPEGVPDLLDLVEGMISQGRLPDLRGLGVYRNWLHVDIREAPALVRWKGAGQGAEPTS